MKIHIVKKGDTLWKIAQKYNLDFEKLQEFNSQLENPDKIFPGMKIKIPTDSVPIHSQFPPETQLQKVSDTSKQVPFMKVAPEKPAKEMPITEEPSFELPPQELAPTPIPEPAPEPAPAPFMQAPIQETPPAPVPQASPFMPTMPMMPIMPPMMPQFAPFPFCPPLKPHHGHCPPPGKHFCNPMELGEMDFNPFQQNPHMMYSPFPYPFPYMAPMPFQSGMPGMPPAPPAPNMGIEPTSPNGVMPEEEIPYQQPYCPPPTKKKKKGRNRG